MGSRATQFKRWGPLMLLLVMLPCMHCTAQWTASRVNDRLIVFPEIEFDGKIKTNFAVQFYEPVPPETKFAMDAWAQLRQSNREAHQDPTKVPFTPLIIRFLITKDEDESYIVSVYQLDLISVRKAQRSQTVPVIYQEPRATVEADNMFFRSANVSERLIKWYNGEWSTSKDGTEKGSKLTPSKN